MWSPAPALGGALWQGNQTLATTRQLLSTSAGLANEGDSNFNTANISTLFVSTITGFNNGTQPIRIQNVSSIFISTARSLVMNGSTFTLKAYADGEILTNGSLRLDNKDYITGSRAGKATNIFTGEGSFQALDGILTLGGSEAVNMFGGNEILMTTAFSQNGLPDGIVDISGNNLLNARSISSIAMSTGTLKAGDITANSLSSIFVSTGAVKAGATVLDSLGVAGTTSLSNTLNMNSQNITNVNTIGATTGNFTSITGNLTGNVSGNVTGNVTGNLTGNVTGNIYNSNLTVGGKYSITETADVGSAVVDYASYGTVNISAKGGLGGLVNITADVATPNNPAFTVSQLTMEAKGNYGNFFITPPEPYLGYFPRGGLVSIIARQGLTPTPPATVVSQLVGNGEIDLTAYSYNLVPGLIKMSAGANSMYAGPVSPITGIMGTNNIYGTVANTITAGTPPSVVPTFAGTNYLYGANGTSIQNTLFVDNITNYGNFVSGQYSNLSIFITTPTGQPARDVLMSNVKYIYMQNNPTIDGAGTGSINSFSNINGSNLNIYKQGYISSLTVDDIVWNRGSENFNTLYTSTLGVSTITGFNNGTQTINMLNTSSIFISSGRQVLLFGSNVGGTAQDIVQFIGSNVLLTASNTMAFDCRGTTQGKLNLLASTLSLYAQNDTLISANDGRLDLTSGTDTVLTTGGIFYADVAQDIRLNTPQVLVQTHLDTPSLSTINFQASDVKVQTHIDTPSISTINFQATNFLATTTTVASETVSGTLTAPLISTTTINNILGAPIAINAPSVNVSGNINATNVTATTNVSASFVAGTTAAFNTVTAATGNITSVNATTVGATNVNTTTTTLQNIKGNPNLSISTGTLLLQTTVNEPVTITTNFTSIGLTPWVCPAGVTSIQLTLSGAGGGVNNTGAYSTPGRGGLVSGTLAVTPGQTYNVTVGEGGGTSPAGRMRYNGGGQGASTGCDGGGATFFQNAANVVLVAAGGGGGGAQINSSSNNVGGDGGGLVGGTGGGSDPSISPPQTGGNGGTQSAAGTAPTAPNNDGNNGSGINGGAGIAGTGAGGGGYWGGASGGFNAPSPDSYGGGGGGSSYVANLTGTVVNTQGGGAAITRNGSASISYMTTDVAPNVIFDAYVDVQNKLTFNEKSIVSWQQSLSESQTGTAFYQTGWSNAVDPASGSTFSPTDYVMTSALTQTGIGQPYAVATSYISQRASGGVYQIQGTLWSATAALPTDNRTALWTAQITMIPIELCPGGLVSQTPPSTINTDTPLNNPQLYLSSITSAALTLDVGENLSLLAGIPVPTYLSTGSITIAGTNNVDVLGNVVALGGNTDVDIEALTNNVNITAASNINLTASNLIYTGASKLWGSNVGNSLGLYRPLRFYYEPPTAAGQSAEINIEAHPADAGVVFSLRYGVDLAGGYGYLLCEWPGYIVVPMKIYGQDIALEGGETVHINANSGNVTLHATGSVVTDAPIDMSNHNINNISTATSKFLIATGATGYGTQTPISPLALVNGNGAGRSQIEFQYWEGGYKHFITSEHYGGGAAGNSLSFWIYDYSVPGSGGSSTPGTGNTRMMVMDATGITLGGSYLSVPGYLTLSGSGTPLYMNGNTIYTQGGIIDLGGTSSNNAYISGLNHIYGNPLTAGGYFGGMVIDYMGALIWNGGGNNASIVVQNSSKVLFIDNQAADILIDSHGYGVNIYGVGVNINPPITFHDEVYTDLGSTPVRQPVIQYGEDSGSGTSGNITIAIPVAYTSATSYVAFASMMDTGDCKISVNRDSASQITIYWSQAGSGTHAIGWNTMGV